MPVDRTYAEWRDAGARKMRSSVCANAWLFDRFVAVRTPLLDEGEGARSRQVEALTERVGP